MSAGLPRSGGSEGKPRFASPSFPCLPATLGIPWFIDAHSRLFLCLHVTFSLCISLHTKTPDTGFTAGGSVVEESTCQCRSAGLIPGLEKSLGEGNGNPLQYSCQENSVDRGAWWAIVHTVTKSLTQLSMNTCTHAIPV